MPPFLCRFQGVLTFSLKNNAYLSFRAASSKRRPTQALGRLFEGRPRGLALLGMPIPKGLPQTVFEYMLFELKQLNFERN
jgi:hypothetical protein